MNKCWIYQLDLAFFSQEVLHHGIHSHECFFEQLFGVIDDHITILPEAHAVQRQNLPICNSTNRHPGPVKHLSWQIKFLLILQGQRWRRS